MMLSFRLGDCPRCRGDLALTNDLYGPYWHCLQCGWHENPRSSVRSPTGTTPLPRWLGGTASRR